MKRTVPPIEGKRVVLRLLQKSDLPTTLAWRNLPEIRKGFFHSDPITPEQHQLWFDEYQARENDYVFMILEKAEADREIGQVSLYEIDWKGGNAEFGRLMIGRAEARSRGLAREACHQLIQFSAEMWTLLHFHLEVYRANGRAVRLYESLGFHETAGSEAVVTMELRLVESPRGPG